MNLSLFLRVNLSFGFFPVMTFVLFGIDSEGLCSEALLLFSADLMNPTAECFEQKALNSTYKRERGQLSNIHFSGAKETIWGGGNLTLGCPNFPHISI
jgi:hypothetical protein